MTRLKEKHLKMTLLLLVDLGIGLNTSFTGEDSLDVTIDAGNVTEGVAQLTETQVVTN